MRGVAVGVGIILLSLSSLLSFVFLEPNLCTMTYMWPNYHLIHRGGKGGGYSLNAYTEANVQLSKFGQGIPILFIPGNAASGKQVRSLASNAARVFSQNPVSLSFRDGDHMFSSIHQSQLNELDYFFVHFEEEFSAFDGDGLRQQTEFVVESINFIQNLYKDKNAHLVLIGHSMGGVIAQAAALSPSVNSDFISTIVSFCSPHKLMPAVVSQSVASFYSQVQSEWKSKYGFNNFNKKNDNNNNDRKNDNDCDQLLPGEEKRNIVLLSIGGGARDIQVREDLTDTSAFCPSSMCLGITSTAVPDTWCATDHQASVWCNELVKRVNLSLFAMISPQTKQLCVSPSARMMAFRQSFISSFHSAFAANLGLPSHHHISHSSFPPQKLLPENQLQDVMSLLKQTKKEDIPLSLRSESPTQNVILWRPSSTGGIVISDMSFRIFSVTGEKWTDLTSDVISVRRTVRTIPVKSQDEDSIIVILPTNGCRFVLAVPVQEEATESGIVSTGASIFHFHPPFWNNFVIPRIVSLQSTSKEKPLFTPFFFEMTNAPIIADRISPIQDESSKRENVVMHVLDAINYYITGSAGKDVALGAVGGSSLLLVAADPARRDEVRFSYSWLHLVAFVLRHHAEKILCAAVGFSLFLIAGFSWVRSFITVAAFLTCPGEQTETPVLSAIILTLFTVSVSSVLMALLRGLRLLFSSSVFRFFDNKKIFLILLLLSIVHSGPLFLFAVISLSRRMSARKIAENEKKPKEDDGEIDSLRVNNNNNSSNNNELRLQLSFVLLIAGLLQIPMTISIVRSVVHSHALYFLFAVADFPSFLSTIPLGLLVFYLVGNRKWTVLVANSPITRYLIAAAAALQCVFARSHIYRIIQILGLFSFALLIVHFKRQRTRKTD